MALSGSLANTIAKSQYAVGKSTAAQTANVNSTSNNKLNMQNFMVLLTTELANQDPTKPMDDSSFFSQIAQMNTAQGMDNLNNNSQIQEAQSLMGQVVTATNPDAATNIANPIVTGTVGRLTVQNGIYYLGIQDAGGNYTDVTMDSIQAINPGNTVTNPAQLIGRYISGPEVTSGLNLNTIPKTITGQVIGLTTVNGKTLLEVQEANGTTVTVDPSKVSNVAAQ
jgi:flagellar basal-body rod modification protein FlgD